MEKTSKMTRITVVLMVALLVVALAFMALFALSPAITAKATPAVYEGGATLDLDALQVGDVIAGAYSAVTGNTITEIDFVPNRYAAMDPNEVATGTAKMDIEAYPSSFINKDGTICFHINDMDVDFYPIAENGERSTTWVVTAVEEGAVYFGGQSSSGSGGGSGGVNFVKVTAESQITEANIGECTFAEAKQWIYNNWDEVFADAEGSQPFDFFYYAESDYYYIPVKLDDYSTKDVFDANCTGAYDDFFENIALYLSDYGEIVYLCDPSSVSGGGSGGEQPSYDSLAVTVDQEFIETAPWTSQDYSVDLLPYLAGNLTFTPTISYDVNDSSTVGAYLYTGQENMAPQIVITIRKDKTADPSMVALFDKGQDLAITLNGNAQALYYSGENNFGSGVEYAHQYVSDYGAVIISFIDYIDNTYEEDRISLQIVIPRDGSQAQGGNEQQGFPEGTELYVAGVDILAAGTVSSETRPDVSGTATVQFVAESNFYCLTLDNFVYEGDGYNGSAIYFKGTEECNRLTIVVIGENSFECSSTQETGMITLATSDAGFIIEGNGNTDNNSLYLRGNHYGILTSGGTSSISFYSVNMLIDSDVYAVKMLESEEWFEIESDSAVTLIGNTRAVDGGRLVLQNGGQAWDHPQHDPVDLESGIYGADALLSYFKITATRAQSSQGGGAKPIALGTTYYYGDEIEFSGGEYVYYYVPNDWKNAIQAGTYEVREPDTYSSGYFFFNEWLTGVSGGTVDVCATFPDTNWNFDSFTGIRCSGGDGSEENPYVFELITDENPQGGSGGDPTPATHTHNDITFKAWESTNSLPTSAGNYYLTADVHLQEIWWVPSEGITNLCLNGHGITMEGNDCVMYLQMDAELNIYDCEETEHKFTVNDDGFATVDDTLTSGYETFTGGYITGGKGYESRQGGAIYIVQSTVNLYGGTIIGNRVSQENCAGSAVYVGMESHFGMCGGAICYNHAGSGGAAIDVELDDMEIHIQGAPIVKGNTAGDSSAASNIRVSGPIVIDEALTADAKLGVSLASGTGVLTSGWHIYMDGEDPAEYFTSDAEGLYFILNQDGEVEITDASPATPAGHAHNDIIFEAWESTTSLPDSAGSYYLTADVTISSSWTVPSGTTNLCLNGFGIKMTGYDQSVIKVGNGATLNVYDCGETVHYFDVHSNGYAININETEGNGRESFVGGYVTGGQGTDLGGDRVLGGGFFVTGGTLHMYGGTVIGNYMTREFVKGAGVWVGYGGTFTMEDGVCIKYNWSDNVGGGVGVGAITDLNSSSGTFIMNGGEISHNRAAAGGGIMLRAGTVDLRGGTITNNSARDSGGGIDYEYQSVSTLTISGNPVVNGNTVNDHPHVNNVVLRGGTKPMIQISGALTSGANIHVMLGNDFPPTSTDGIFTSSWSTYMGDADPADYFVSENGDYGVYLVDGEAYVGEAPAPAAHTHNDITFTAWEGTTSLPTEEGSYYLTADVNISSTWTVPSGTTNLCLNGFGIKKTGSNDSAVYVPSSAILNIYDCKDTEHKFTVDGNSIATIDDSLTSGYQTFIGGYITGGRGKASTGNRNGGGIFIDGECNLYGGNVIGNSVTVSDNCGAGVFCNDNSLFRMYGGSISYNYAQNAGCGVFAWHNSEAQIWGGEISHNKTSHASGSAISFYNPNGYTVSLKLYGGYIHDNLTGSTGGAVSLSATGLTVGLKGNLIVWDNATASTNGNATLNVYVSNTPINIEGALTNTEKIGLRLASGTGTFTSGWSTHMGSADPADYFYSENGDYQVYLLDGEAAILAEDPNASAITLGTGLLYVGGVDIVAAENYTVNGNGGGTAVLSQGADGNPVLTLTNFVYTGAGYGGKYGYEGGAIDFRTDYNETGFDLTILLVGNNTITKADDGGINMSHGIYFASNNHSLIIDGEGSLTINFADDRSGCFKSNGIFLEPGTFVMNGGTVVSNGGIGSEESLGIYSNQSIVFNGGSFTGNGYTTYDWHSFGIYCSSITVNGGMVYASSPLDNGEDDSCAFDISTFIINGGTVTAYGKVAFSSTWGIQCGENSTWTILAGEDEASATEVSSIDGNEKYVHIVAQSKPPYKALDPEQDIDIDVPDDKDYAEDGDGLTVDTDATPVEIKWYYDDDGDGIPDGDPIGEGSTYNVDCPQDEGHTIIAVIKQTEDEDGNPYADGQAPTVTTNGVIVPVKYDLYIAGTQVTSKALSGNGWSYNPTTNTLTLNGFTYEGEGSDNSKYWRFNSVVTYAGEDPFTLILLGANSITNTKAEYDYLMALLSTGDLTIGGTGSLALSVSGRAETLSMGLFVDGDLTVNDGTITANGGASGSVSAGIYVSGFRYVQKGGSVVAQGGASDGESYGLYTLGEAQVSSAGLDVSAGEAGVNGITIGSGIKKFVAVGYTSAIYTKAAIDLKLGGTAWTDVDKTANSEAISVGAYENADLATYKYIDIDSEPAGGAENSRWVIKMKAKASVPSDYAAYLANGEKIVRIYDVTLYRIDIMDGVAQDPVAVQPSATDLGTITVKLSIPDALLGKTFRILHVHGADDYAFVDYTMDTDGKHITIRGVDRLSDFAFVANEADLEPSDPDSGNEGQGGNQGEGGSGEQGGNQGEGGEEQGYKPFEVEPEITKEDDPTKDNLPLVPQGGQEGNEGGESGEGEQGEPAKPAVTVALEDTDPEDAEGVTVEVEVKTEVSEEVTQSENNALTISLQSDDEIAIVYDVKLIRTTVENGVEIREEIQPSDIKPGTVVVINMNIPEELRGKPFKLLHIHSEDDIKEIASYTVSEDGATLSVRVDRLSEFAFVGKKVADGDVIEPNKLPNGAIAGIVIGGSFGVLLIGLWIFFLLRRGKRNNGDKGAKKAAPKTKKAAAAIIAAPVVGVKKNVGFYRIIKDEEGECTFTLLYDEDDKLSKEMGVFESEKEAYKAIKRLREKAVDAKAENRVKNAEEAIPAPKFVLDVDKKGVYRYSFISEDGTVLLQSVTYLNEKRCLEDLKKTLIAVGTEEVVVENGELKEDVIDAVEETPVVTAAEEVQEAEIKDLPVEEEPKDEGVSLKENIAIAKATVSHSAVNKQYVADYLKTKYDEGVRLNRRGNETKTGLPLADTHYAIGEERNLCFVYVYEVEGTTMLLVKVGDEYGQALAEKHPIVKRSAFPKSKSLWYSVIVDDSFAPEEVEKVLDDAYLMNGGKPAANAGLTLKETLAIAKATTTHSAVNKQYIADYLKTKYEEGVRLNQRGNETKTGLPLADTHYAIGEERNLCFVYVYEVEGTTMLLVKVGDEYGQALAEKHPIVKRSAFPKSKSLWYSVIVDDSFAPEEVEKVLDDAYLMNGGKPAANAGLSLKESLAMAKETTTTIHRSKKGIADYLAEEYGEEVELNQRVNKTKTGLPLADTHYAVSEEGKRCFAYVYETDGTVVLLLRLTEAYAESVRADGHRIIRSAFPKSKYAWYTVILDDTYSEAGIQEILTDAYNMAR